jgi:hemolysin activation/secretion protein
VQTSFLASAGLSRDQMPSAVSRRARLGARARGLSAVVAACALGGIAFGGVALAQDAAGDQEPRFDIQAIDVDGNTVLDQMSLEKAIYPFMGPGRTRADVAAAQKALEEAYHAKGFQTVVVEVPRQNVSEGVVKLHVVEAPIGRLRVVGSKYHSLDGVKDAAPALAEGKVPDLNQAQAEISAANRLPGRQITPIIRAGVAPGTVDIDLQVTEEPPLHGSLELNNDHSGFTRPLRLSANLRYDNLWQRGHSLSATYQVAPERQSDAEVYAGSYVAPIWGTPFTALLYGFHSNSDVATLGGVSVLGKGTTVGTRLIYQFPSSGSISQSFSAGIDYKKYFEFVRLQSTEVSSGQIEYWPLNGAYTWRRQTESSTTATVAVTANIRGFGDDDRGFKDRRGDARANFIHLNLDLEHTRPVGRGFDAIFRFAGQISETPLPSAEQFSAGGLTSVRGYLSAEAVGDGGVFGSIELQSPVLYTAPGLLEDWRTYAFLDGAGAWVLEPATEQREEFFLYSAGLGTRVQLLKRLHGDVVAAFPLRNGPSRTNGRPYFSFSLKAEF